MEPAQEKSSRATAARRWGPIAAIIIAAVVVVVILVATPSNDEKNNEASSATTTVAEETSSPTTTMADSDSESEAGSESESESESEEPTVTTTTEAKIGGPSYTIDPNTESPEGVLSYPRAEEMGIADTIDWGDRCDTETGQVRIPWFFRIPCWMPFEGDNGGATDNGVTEDTIRIVYWTPQDNDPVMAYITDAIMNDDTNADVEDTLNKLIEYYETYYETYGRSVDLTVMTGSGLVLDPISARADAVRIAEEIDPFMVWGGPALTTAFGDELMARGIACFACGLGGDAEDYVARHPNGWSLTMSGEQASLLVAEYIGKRVAGYNAVHAGDSDMHDQERVFGIVYEGTGENAADLNAGFREALGEYGVEVAESISYNLDPATMQETATNTIAKLKASGVTSVILQADPVAPRDFTREATAQGYFPEWIIGGSVLVDTNVFARTYDQEQWANAFGLSTLGTPVQEGEEGNVNRYEWFHGEEAAAADTIGVIDPYPALFYSILSATGPNLTMENFADVMLTFAPTTRGVTVPSISFGYSGRWPEHLEPDYRGIDDITEIWWDADAVGEDDLGVSGSGMYQHVNGGERYLLGEFPEAETEVFNPDNSVAMYMQTPEAEASPYYEPLSATANN